MAQRAGAEITDLDGSHMIMISRPDAVAELISSPIEAVAEPAHLPAPRRSQEVAEQAQAMS
jgi:hypothetical protein